ncbi:zona pellucida sperm-binding protein 1-like isoform X2 [Pogona vitticeps]
MRPQLPQPGVVQPQPGQLRPQVPRPGVVQPQPGQLRPQLPQPGVVQPQPGQMRPQLPQPGVVQPQPGQLQPQVPRPGVVQPQPGQLRPQLPQPGVVHPQPGQIRPQLPQPGVVQPQPGQLRPQLPQPGVVQPQPGQMRPQLPQPGVVQPQPGQLRPQVPRPGVVQPQPGQLRPQLPQPGVVQPQPGQMRPQLPQPGVVQPQPGQLQPQVPRPGVVQPQPGQLRPQLPQPGVVQPQPGQIRPQLPQPGVVQPQPGQMQPQQPGLVFPQPQWPGIVEPQPGQIYPLPQPPGLVFPQLPQPGIVSQQQQHSMGSPPTLEQCRVSSGKIPCGDAQGPAACHQTGCCYNDRDRAIPCYYGNTVTVQCLRDGHFIVVVSRDMLDYPIILDSVKLSYAQAGCDPVRKTESFLVFRFPLTQCGTTVQVTGGRLVYENQLVSGIDILSGPDGSITRDSTFILNARCIYNATDFLPVQVEVFSLPTIAPVLRVGPLRLELRIATDSSYRSYYSDTDYPVVKLLRDPVYVEVQLLQRMDPSLVLVLHECWATPNTNPLEQLQWPILVDGCPFEGDNYQTQLVPMGPATSELPFPTHYQRFIISTFTFVDATPQVYLFCSVSVCHPSPQEPCRATCQMPVLTRGRRFLETRNKTDSLDLVSTPGALIFQDRQSNEKQVKWEKGVTSSEDLTLALLVVLPLVGIIMFVGVLVLWKKKKSRTTKL